jgi:hypothetical protein
MNTNVKTVFGASLSHAGVHPLIKKRGPSFRKDSVTIMLILWHGCQLVSSLLVDSAYRLHTIDDHSVLNPAFQYICRRACRRSDCSGEQRGQEMRWNSIPKLQGRIRQQEVLGSRISAGSAFSFSSRSFTYVAIWETSAMHQWGSGVAMSIQLTHENAADDVRAEASCECSQTFLTTDPDDGIQGVSILKPLRQRLRAVCAHPDQRDLADMSTGLCWRNSHAHLSRVSQKSGYSTSGPSA